MDAERDISKANPPMSRKETGEVGGRGNKKVGPLGPDLSTNIIKLIRDAYSVISDAELDEMKQEAIETSEPLTRSKIKKVGRGWENRLRYLVDIDTRKN